MNEFGVEALFPTELALRLDAISASTDRSQAVHSWIGIRSQNDMCSREPRAGMNLCQTSDWFEEVCYAWGSLFQRPVK
jgi:hypothetical protein